MRAVSSPNVAQLARWPLMMLAGFGLGLTGGPEVVRAATSPPASVASTASSTTTPGSPSYHLAREIPLSGTDFWDYRSVDSTNTRLFITHGSHVQVVDTKQLALIGEIADTPGAHGVAFAPDLGRGFVSAGGINAVIVFDLHSLQRIAAVQVTGKNPDAIVYDPFTRRVFTFNGFSDNVTAIDAKSNAVVGTIALNAKPEFAVSDAAGRLYVNLADRDRLAVLDPLNLRVLATWPMPGCKEPGGLAIDRAHARLFSSCDNRVMLVLDATSGKVLAMLPIGDGVDAVTFDDSAGLAFASAGETGSITVVHEDSSQRFSVVQTVTSADGARTATVDPTTHRLFSVTARIDPHSATGPRGGPPGPGGSPRGLPSLDASGQPILPKFEAGSFHLLVFER